MEPVPVHPLMKDLEWILGNWHGEGVGEYPKIDTFSYTEELSISHCGQPNFAINSITKIKGKIMHRETGFITVEKKKLENPKYALMISQNTGLCEMDEGHLDKENKKLFLTSTGVQGISFGKEPRVTKMIREFCLEDKKLAQLVSMETTETPMNPHLKASYQLVGDTVTPKCPYLAQTSQ